MPTPSVKLAAPRLSQRLLQISFLIVTAVLSAGAIWLIQQLQALRCPAGTFLAASAQGLTLQILPISMASFGVAFLAVNWLFHRIPPLRGASERDVVVDRDAKRRKTPWWLRLVIQFPLILLATMLPISIAGSLCQYCLAQQEILYQPWPWTGLQHYSWQDVATVETSCDRTSRGGWSGSFLLIMKDGASLDIMTWPRVGARAYPDIVRSLEGVPFAFDSTAVGQDCNFVFASLLRRRP